MVEMGTHLATERERLVTLRLQLAPELHPDTRASEYIIEHRPFFRPYAKNIP
jgi:hypothetical protein